MKAPSWKEIRGTLRRTQTVPAPQPAASFWEQFRLRAAALPRRPAAVPSPTAALGGWSYVGWSAAAAAVIVLGVIAFVVTRPERPSPGVQTAGQPGQSNPAVAMRAPPALPLTPQTVKPEIQVAASAPATATPLSGVESVDVQVGYRSVMIVQDEAHGGTLVWLAGVDADR